MKKSVVASVAVSISAAVLLAANIVMANTPSQPPHQLFNEGDLKLESGEVIKDFSISYVTHGTLNAKKSNAILVVTAVGGNHHRIDFMIGPGKALDPDKYFIIATDAISNGLTTSPSNSTVAAPDVVSQIHDPRHGGIAIPSLEREVRDRTCGCCRWPLDGRHAGPAVGRQPPRDDGRSRRHGAARQNAGMDGGRSRNHPEGHHA